MLWTSRKISAADSNFILVCYAVFIAWSSTFYRNVFKFYKKSFVQRYWEFKENSNVSLFQNWCFGLSRSSPFLFGSVRQCIPFRCEVLASFLASQEVQRGPSPRVSGEVSAATPNLRSGLLQSGHQNSHDGGTDWHGSGICLPETGQTWT